MLDYTAEVLKILEVPLKNPDSVGRADLSGQTSVLLLRSSNNQSQTGCVSFLSFLKLLYIECYGEWKMSENVLTCLLFQWSNLSSNASSLTTRTFTRLQQHSLTYKLKCVSVSSEYFWECEDAWAVQMMVRKTVGTFYRARSNTGTKTIQGCVFWKHSESKDFLVCMTCGLSKSLYWAKNVMLMNRKHTPAWVSFL